MAIPALPAQGSTSWYGWATGVHGAVAATPVPSATDTGYDIVLLMGQSNMQGADTATALIDVANPRVWSFPSTGGNANKIVQAVDPLAHLNPAATGVGPGMSFAHWYAGMIPGTRRVLLVPCASSGSGFINTGGTSKWDPYPTWPNDSNNLYNRTIDQATAALAAAGPNSRIIAALWVQGEADFNVFGNTYRDYLEALIDGLRQRLNLLNLPFVIGSMLPEYASGSTIDLVHQNTPNRKPYTSYVAGPTGYALGTDTPPSVHYNAAGARELGRRFVAGLLAALANTNPPSLVATNPPGEPGTVAPVTALGATTDTFTTLAESYAYDGAFSVSGGQLQVPVTAAYPSMNGPSAGTLIGSFVSCELISVPQLGVNSSVYVAFGALLSAGNYVGFAFSGAAVGQPKGAYVTPEFKVGGNNQNIVTGYSGYSGNTADRFYRIRESAGSIYWETSTNGSTWVERASTTNAGLDLTSVRPFWQGGHWNTAEPDDFAVFDNLNLFT